MVITSNMKAKETKTNKFMFDQVGSKASILFPKKLQQQSDPTRN